MEVLNIINANMELFNKKTILNVFVYNQEIPNLILCYVIILTLIRKEVICKLGTLRKKLKKLSIPNKILLLSNMGQRIYQFCNHLVKVYISNLQMQR